MHHLLALTGSVAKAARLFLAAPPVSKNELATRHEPGVPRCQRIHKTLKGSELALAGQLLKT